MIYPEDFEVIVEFLSRVSGISERAAERAALLLNRLSEDERLKVLNAFKGLHRVKSCKKCGLPTEGSICSVCSDNSRDRGTVCVVEQPRDALSIEKIGKFKGLYHVLGGVISPLEDIGPEDINVAGLFERIRKDGIKRVILALNPTVEGEATSKFLLDRLSKVGVEVFRIAYGIPYGGTIDMSDELTLQRAFEDMKLLVGGSNG